MSEANPTYAEYIQRFNDHFLAQRTTRLFSFAGVEVEIDPDVFPSDSPYTFSPQSHRLTLEKDIQEGLIPRDTDMRILDLCTGCGIIAAHAQLMLPNAQVAACDISERAINNARRNFDRLGLDSVELVQSDLFSAFEGREFDLIISSIPFVNNWESPTPESDLLFRFWGEAGQFLAKDGTVLFNWASWADYSKADQAAADNGFARGRADEYPLPEIQGFPQRYTWQSVHFARKPAPAHPHVLYNESIT